jgi:hypothetical protein
MARIFNSIRQRLLKENRLTRYLIYAIGEIVLVVIGILIAVNINDWNTDRKQGREIRQLLTGLEKDLMVNIAACTETMAWIATRDSVIELIIQGKVTRAMYETKEVTPQFRNYKATAIITENLNRILEKEDVMGTEMAPMLALLKTYKQKIEHELITAERFRDYVMDMNTYLVDNMSWLMAYQDSSSAEAVDYFLNDPTYRNKSDFYRTLMTHNYGHLVAERRNTELALLYQLKELDRVASPTDVASEFQELGLSPLKAIDCDTETDLSDPGTKRFTPFIFNAGKDTLEVTLTYQWRKEVRNPTTSIPPGSYMTYCIYFNQYVELSAGGTCIGRYIPIAQGYVIIGNSK